MLSMIIIYRLSRTWEWGVSGNTLGLGVFLEKMTILQGKYMFVLKLTASVDRSLLGTGMCDQL